MILLGDDYMRVYILFLYMFESFILKFFKGICSLFLGIGVGYFLSLFDRWEFIFVYFIRIVLVFLVFT